MMSYVAKLHRSFMYLPNTVALIMLAFAIGCTMGSRGRIFVTDPLSGAMENEIAVSVGAIVLRNGFEESWAITKYQGMPCTMERGCVWIHHDHEPVVSISKTMNGQIKIEVETRNFIHDERVKRVTEEVSQELVSKFGNQNVTIESAY